jgi:hypothetical protein
MVKKGRIKSQPTIMAISNAGKVIKLKIMNKINDISV